MRPERVDYVFQWIDRAKIAIFAAIAVYFLWHLLTPAPPNIGLLLAIVAFGIISVTLSLMELDWKKRRHADHIHRGCCRECGYDIGIQGAAVCPECGAEQTATKGS